jgi:branched-chain amino acid transport system substrate-binding protein
MSLPRFVRPLLQGCLLASFALVAQAQIKVGVVTSSTGPVALVGLPQKKSVPLLPTKVAGQTVQYISLDDGSDPTAAVSAFKKLINEDKVDAIIGPSGSPAAMGVIQFAAAAGVPMLAPVGTAAVVLPMNEQKKWVFKTTQNDEIIARALVQHMSHQGQDGGLHRHRRPLRRKLGQGVRPLAEGGHQDRGQRALPAQDTSVTAQTLKLMGAAPDAILVAAPGARPCCPAPRCMTWATRARSTRPTARRCRLPALGGKKVEGTILAASLMLVLDEVPTATRPRRWPATT